jgi:hypothetical protein
VTVVDLCETHNVHVTIRKGLELLENETFYTWPGLVSNLFMLLRDVSDKEAMQ